LKKVSYLSGGVGGAKFAKGLYQIKNIDLNIIVNTGDDEVINGVFLSPDIDTVIYNLAGIEGKFGWGIKNDKFTVHNHLNKFLKSNFMIGDKDLATNLFRSQQLNNGKSLTEVTEEIKNKFNIKCNIFPMSDSIVSTKLLTKTGKKLDFQEYFVEKKGRPRLKKIIYEGSKIAKVSNTLFKEIKNSDIVIIGPSNPFLSIGPILSLKQIKKVLAEHQNVIVISPFINNKALKGPSKNNFLDMGLTPDIHGLKKFYKNIGNKFIVHFEDSDNSSNTYEENIIFNSNKDSEKLASKIMAL
jgi:LPPG:FO 2-phospho-L-lactate transferase